MFPVECFIPDSMFKMEAVRYYITLNKELLKQSFRSDYVRYIDFLTAQAKSILEKISASQDIDEMYALLSELESALPYAKILCEYTTLNEKINYLHKELAKLELKESSGFVPDRKSSLRIQRDLDREYDELQKLIAKYKDMVSNVQYLKSVSPESLGAICAKGGKMDKSEFAKVFKQRLEESASNLKQFRTDTFKAIRTYYVREIANLLQHELATATIK